MWKTAVAFVIAATWTVSAFGETADEAAIRKMLETRMQYWQERDVAGLASQLTESAQFVDSTGKETTGRKGIEANYQKVLASDRIKNSTSAQAIESIRIVSPEVAIVEGSWTLTPKDTSQAPVRGKSLIVVVNKKGAWLIDLLRADLKPNAEAEEKKDQ